MDLKNVDIKMYDSTTLDEYTAFLKTSVLPQEFYILRNQKLKDNKKIFVLFIENEIKILFWKLQGMPIPIGYCIVEDAKSKSDDLQEYLDRIYDIPLSVISEYPTIISDFMIFSPYRRMGYGRYFANYIVNDVFKDKKIALHAVENGVYFWDKIGFDYVMGANSVMITKDGERIA